MKATVGGEEGAHGLPEGAHDLPTGDSDHQQRTIRNKHEGGRATNTHAPNEEKHRKQMTQHTWDLLTKRNEGESMIHLRP